VLAANPSLGIHDVAGLIKLAKARNAPLTSSSPGPGYARPITAGRVQA
jgi:hypothetical protein